MIHFINDIWLVVYLPLWKIWVRQLGWWHSHMEKKCSKPPIRYSLVVVSSCLWRYQMVLQGTPLKNQLVSQAWKSRAQSPSYPGHFFFATLLSFILKPKDPHPGEGSETPRISEQNKCKWKWHRHAEARYRWTNTPVVSKRHIPSVPMKPPVRWPVSQ